MCVFGGVQYANVVRLKCYLKSDVIKTGQSAIKAQFPYHVQVQGHKMATKKIWEEHRDIFIMNHYIRKQLHIRLVACVPFQANYYKVVCHFAITKKNYLFELLLHVPC